MRTYVLALDNDVAGREGSKKIKTYVRYKFFKQVLYTDGRDINELGALVKNLEIKNLKKFTQLLYKLYGKIYNIYKNKKIIRGNKHERSI